MHMTRVREKEFPVWVWQASIASLLVTIVASLVLLALVLEGIADPAPVGELVVKSDFTEEGWQSWPPGITWFRQRNEYHFDLSENAPAAYLIAPFTLQTPGTIRLQAQQVPGAGDTGYGLWWGDEPGKAHTILVINGNGYFSLFKAQGEHLSEEIEPWQRFPHIRSQGQSNRLQVDLVGGQMVIRINDELVSTYTRPGDALLHMGVYVSAGQGGSTAIIFEELWVWQQPAYSGDFDLRLSPVEAKD